MVQHMGSRHVGALIRMHIQYIHTGYVKVELLCA